MISSLLMALALGADPSGLVESPRQLSEERLVGIRTYRRQHLRLVSEVTYRETLQVPEIGDPLSRDPWASQTTIPQELQRLTVYRGAERISVPQVLDTIGRPEEALTLSTRVQRNRRWGATLYTLGTMGTLTTIGGFVAMERSSVASSERIAATTAGAGLTAMALGFILGTLPNGRARKLQFEPRASRDIAQFDSDLDTYNDGLRLELGLRPADVVLFERQLGPIIYGPR